MANSILTLKYSHTIEFYKETCKETDYSPMSDSSLWRVLHGIKPSQRKALAGLDDVTAAGMNGFKVLIDIAEKMKRSDVGKSLEKGKRYLKSNYPVSCSETSPLSSHSTRFALSYQDDPDLKQVSEINREEECIDCDELHFVLNQIRDLVKASNDGDLQYATNVAIDDVKGYMKHEEKVLTNITAARSGALNASSIEEKIAAENQLSSALSGFNIAVEAYPDLKANANFMQLQEEIADIENKLSAVRRFFNSATKEYNNAVETFPSNLIAGMFSFRKESMFDLGTVDRKTLDQAPKVSF